MACIQKRTSKDGKTMSYRVQVRRKGCPTETATFHSLTRAREWAGNLEAAIREGRHFKASQSKKHTAAEMIARYVRDVLPRKRDYDTQKRQLEWWTEAIGRLAIADVTPAVVAEQRDILEKGTAGHGGPRQPGTVNRYLAVLSHVFTVAAKEWYWLDLNEHPARSVSRLREPEGRIRFLSDDERGRLLAATKESKNPYLHTITVLALSTGMRRGEIMGLTWDKVDLDRGMATLEETKNQRRRHVPLTGHALDLVRDLKAKRNRVDTRLLFPSPLKAGVKAKPTNIENAWRAALKRAEIEDFRFHDLRHSAASYLAMSGATPPEIAAVLGHRTLQMVARYAHLSQDHTSGVVAKMNARIFGPDAVEDDASGRE